jgi:hypothetical protein
VDRLLLSSTSHWVSFLRVRLDVANSASHKERPETPPSPFSTVPFHRDVDFIDHGTLLDQIHEKGSAPASRIALFGLGGVGYVENMLYIVHY